MSDGEDASATAGIEPAPALAAPPLEAQPPEPSAPSPEAQSPETAAPPPRPGPPPTVTAIVRDALDALVAAGSELRVLSAAVVLFGVAAVGLPLGSAFFYAAVIGRSGDTAEAQDPLLGLLLFVALVVGFIGFLVLFVQIPLLIVASVGGRLAGEPLSLRQSLRRARQVFLRGLGAAFLVGLATGIPTGFIQGAIVAVLGTTELAAGLALVGGAVFASPWVYVFPGIVLGGVGIAEAMRRSWRLARFRWRVAVTIALLSVVGQFIVLAAAETTIGVVLTVGGLAEPGAEAAASAQPVFAIGVFAVGAIIAASVVFGIQVVQFAPQAAGFYALTRYAGGLDAVHGGPREPLFHPRALVFYGIGIVAGVVLLVRALQLST